MQSTSCCKFEKGRVVEWEAMDYIVKGMQVVQAKKVVGDMMSDRIEGADLETN